MESCMRVYYIIILILILPLTVYSQNVGIGEDSTFVPDPSAILELNTSSMGFLMPRMTQDEKVAISNPAHGLMIIQTNSDDGEDPGIWYYSVPDGRWIMIFNQAGMSGNFWNLLGNSSTDPNVNYIGTADAQDLVFKTNATERLRINSGGGALLYGNLGIADPASSFTNNLITSPSQTATYNYTLPNDGPTADYFLRVDATGNLSWSDPSPYINNTFDLIGTGTNTSATMTVGSGAYLVPENLGVVTANTYTGTGSTTDQVDLGTGEVNGVLDVSNGGTGLANIPENAVLYGNSTGGLSYLETQNDSYLTTDASGSLTWLPNSGGSSGLEGSGSNNEIAVFSGSSSLTSSPDFTWDDAASEFIVNGAVTIGSNSSPDASAVLDIQSSTQGVLMPRMTENDRTSISNPATGLIVYQTDGDEGFYYYDGTQWQLISTGGSDYWSLYGNASTDSTNNFIGTTDAQPVVFKTNNTERMRINSTGQIGIGTATPSSEFEVQGNIGLSSAASSTATFYHYEPDGGGNYSSFTTGSQSSNFNYVWPVEQADNNSKYNLLSNNYGNGPLNWVKASDIINVNITVTPSSSDYNANLDDFLIVISSPGSTVYLPEASTAEGKVYYVVISTSFGNNQDGYITRSGSDVIAVRNDLTTATLSYGNGNSDFSGALLVSDGISTWYVISTRRANQ